MAQTVQGSPATVVGMNLAMYGVTPSNAIYLAQLAVVGDNNAHAAEFANKITDANYARTSDNALATFVLNNMLGTAPVNSAALHDQVAMLLSANPGNRGVVIYQLAQLLSGLESNADYGAAATSWNTRVDLGYAFSSTPGSTVDIKGGPGDIKGPLFQTFVLTRNTDSFIGSVGDDLFVSTESTLGVGDALNGGGGNDQLRFASSGTAAVSKSGFSTTGIQKLIVTSDAIDGTTMDTSLMAGLDTLVNDNSSTTVVFDKVMGLDAVTLTNVAGGDTVLNFSPGVADGKTDALALALSNNKTINNGSIGSFQANGVERFSITTSAGPSNLAEIKSNTLQSVSIAGDQSLTLHQLNFFNPGGTNTVDASALTGRLDLTLGSSGTPGNTTVVKGGGNTDTRHFSGNLADYQLIKTGNGFTVHDQRVTLLPVGDVQTSSVERLVFHDQGLAFDLGATQSAGKTVMVVAAALGGSYLKNANFVGQALAYFDAGFSVQDGANLALASGLVGTLAGGSGNAALVGWVWHNLFGYTPEAPQLATLTAPLDNHSLTQAQWLAALAQSDIAQVQLAGYAAGGLAYTL